MTKKQLIKKQQAFERKAKKQWKQLSQPQKNAVVAGAVVQLTLLAAAQIDIAKRPAEDIRGSKWLWRVVTLVNFVGPLAYFLIGRKKSSSRTATVDTIPREAAA